MSLTDFELDWRLEEIFKIDNGLPDWFAKLDHQLAQMEKAYPLLEQRKWAELISILSSVGAWMREGFGFVSCLMASDPHFTQLSVLQTSLVEMEKKYSALMRQFELYLAQQTEHEFDALLKLKQADHLKPILMFRRKCAQTKMRADQEQVVQELAQHSFYPLTQLYHQLASSLRAISEEGDQAWNMQEVHEAFRSPDRQLRERVFDAAERTWRTHEHLFAHLLNQFIGFRKAVSRMRQWPGPFKESLQIHKCSESLVNMMWKAVDEMKAPLIVLLKKKAEILQRKRLTWFDLLAPLPQENHSPLSWKEALSWLQAGLVRTHQDMGDYFKYAKRNGWVFESQHLSHASSLPSFAVPFPIKRQVRIYISYHNRVEDLLSASRQVVQAWHYHLLFDEPELNQQNTIIINEALGTFTERFILEIIKDRAHTRQQHFDALYEHVYRHMYKLLDGQLRYQFEQELYAMNRESSFAPDQLCRIMEKVQREVFANQLSLYHKHYWISQSDFYDSSSTFNQWPIVLGNLLGFALYQTYLKQPKNFSQKLNTWLVLASRHYDLSKAFEESFGINPEERLFWTGALKVLESDVQELSKLLNIKDKTFTIESKTVG